METAIGATLGPSRWLSVTQARIDAFAEATGDHQWIHTDPARAGLESPYRQTVAHGYLTLSLLSGLVGEIFPVEANMGVNYGLNRVRFPAPVLSGSKVRLVAVLKEVRGLEGGAEVVLDATFENDGQAKPVCVAQGGFAVLFLKQPAQVPRVGGKVCSSF